VYRYIKIFGERCSGTKFLNEFLSRNLAGISVLSHKTNEVPRARADLFAGDYPGEILDTLVLERFIDQQRKKEFPSNYGWKHASVSESYLRSSPLFSETLFIFIVRNPFYFLNSLFLRQQNLYPQRAGIDRKRFVRSPIVANERDNLDDILVDSPIVLWNKKNRSYVETVKDLDNAKLVRFEDLVQDPQGFLHWIETAGITLAGELDVPQESTNRATLGFEDYKAKALSYQARCDFSDDEIDFINAAIDRELADIFGYSDATTEMDKPTWTNGKFSFLRG
jgi:hypothetical protein